MALHAVSIKYGSLHAGAIRSENVQFHVDSRIDHLDRIRLCFFAIPIDENFPIILE